jgi:D-alanine--D-alanine ligase
MKVAVVSGGFSEEKEASKKSGECVSGALETLGHNVVLMEYDENLIGNLRKTAPDIVFHSVMGKYHGDGAIQALLELAGIPYVGSRSQSAAIINHKTICKKIWRADGGIPTPDFFEYSHEEYKKDSFENFQEKVKNNGLTLPVVVKPPTQGNRYGIVFVKDSSSFKKLETSFLYDDVLLAERYVEGRFFTQGIIEINGKMTALPPVEITDSSDSEFKLFPGGSVTHIHDFVPERLAEISAVTLKAAFLTGASCYGRLDYHLSGGKLYLLEINAVPGLIPSYSSMTDCASAAGYNYVKFIDMLLATAKGGRSE